MTIILTEAAAAEVRRAMETQKLEDAVLRMGIAGGGCSGLQYMIGFDDEFDPDVDVQFENHGVTLTTSKKFALHLDGASIDFKEGPMGRGLAVENPNWKAGGGCPGCGH